MTKEEYRKNAYDMIYLTACAINEKVPDENRIQGLDLSSLFLVCQRHILTACVDYALESAGIHDHDFVQAKEKSIRKNIILDTERKKILAELEKAKIWYMPLKGAVMKDWYPKLGMRQMSDNDILCDSHFPKEIKKIMLGLGFTCERFDDGHDDAYHKPPVYNFEMHRRLFSEIHVGKLHQYYSNVKETLIKDDNKEYAYHFTNEDFYVYMIAHEYKHYVNTGIGIRFLLDIEIAMRKLKEHLAWEEVHEKLQNLEIAEFEQQSRELAIKIFNFQELTDDEKSLLDYYIFSDAYGKISNHVDNTIKTTNRSKADYVFHRLFISMEEYKVWFPWAYRHKWLIPVAWTYRLFRGVFKRNKKISAEMKYLMKQNKE